MGTPLPQPPARRRFQRARSASEKLDRRRAILEAADAHVRAVGFDAFSMGALAREAGMAKGTLYLYFDTREEVLLALHSEQLERFAAMLTRRTRPGIPDAEFATVFLDCARRDPVFVDFASRLGSVIEQNISVERLIESKRAMRDLLLPLAAHVENCLGLGQGAGASLLGGLMALLIGASQIDAGPSVDDKELPVDVRAMIGVFSCERLYLDNAAVLIAGARSPGPSGQRARA